LQLNFEVLNITVNSLLQNGFVFMVHTVFFGQLVFRKIIKIVATRGQILRLKCTKFDFGWSSAPDPAGGAYSAPPDPLAGFKGTYF